jgi:hypothetical protein
MPMAATASLAGSVTVLNWPEFLVFHGGESRHVVYGSLPSLISR